jgi:hypothetical protein
MDKDEMKDIVKSGTEKIGEKTKEFGKKAGESAKKVGIWLGDKLKKGIAWGGAEIKAAPVRVEKITAAKRKKDALESLGKIAFEGLDNDSDVTLSVNDENVESLVQEIRSSDKIIADCEAKLAAIHSDEEDVQS